MRLSELVECIHESHPEIKRSQAVRVVELICSEITKALADNGRVEIRGFGVFYLSKRKSRELSNPRSGGKVTVAARSVPRFKAGKELREELNSSGKDPL